MLQATVPWTCQQYTTDMNRKYSQWVKEVEHGVLHHWFLVQQEEWLVSVQISIMQDKLYSLVVSWLRTELSYASFRAAVLCIRGSRSSHHHPIYDHDLTLAIVEGKIPSSVKTSISNTCFLCLVLYSKWIIVFG